jgi:hypothetical protein
MNVLITNVVDRYAMGEALVNAGCKPFFGDLMFSFGLPIPIRKLSTARFLAAIILPIMEEGVKPRDFRPGI